MELNDQIRNAIRRYGLHLQPPTPITKRRKSRRGGTSGTRDFIGGEWKRESVGKEEACENSLETKLKGMKKQASEKGAGQEDVRKGESENEGTGDEEKRKRSKSKGEVQNRLNDENRKGKQKEVVEETVEKEEVQRGIPVSQRRKKKSKRKSSSRAEQKDELDAEDESKKEKKKKKSGKRKKRRTPDGTVDVSSATTEEPVTRSAGSEEMRTEKQDMELEKGEEIEEEKLKDSEEESEEDDSWDEEFDEEEKEDKEEEEEDEGEEKKKEKKEEEEKDGERDGKEEGEVETDKSDGSEDWERDLLELLDLNKSDEEVTNEQEAPTCAICWEEFEIDYRRAYEPEVSN